MRHTLILLVFLVPILPAMAQREPPAMQALERRIEAVARTLEPNTAGDIAQKCARADDLLLDGETAYDPSEIDLIDIGMCVSYFTAILETFEAFKDEGAVISNVCEPQDGLTGAILKEAFMEYLSEHPSSKDSPPAIVAMDAWADRFSCR